MRYEDAARRYNFLAGLGIGAVLGVGLALLALPQKKVLRREAKRGAQALSASLKKPRRKASDERQHVGEA